MILHIESAMDCHKALFTTGSRSNDFLHYPNAIVTVRKCLVS